jgi:hypothetical protein
VLQWGVFHLGWDGAAFSLDFRSNSSPDVLMLRLAPDGSEVLAPTQVGSIATIERNSSSFHTDADTGTTWLASDAQDGVWLSGHLRDGSPLPGMEAEEYMLVRGQGVPPTWVSQFSALSSDGESALVGWSTNSEMTVYLQPVAGAQELGNAFVLVDSPTNTAQGPALARKQMLRLDDGWWLGGAYYHLGSTNQSDAGIVSFWLGETASGAMELTGRDVLVGFPPCWPGCENEFSFDIRYFASLRYENEIWFGFQDKTNGAIEPYRIVRVGSSCRYPTNFEITNPDI